MIKRKENFVRKLKKRFGEGIEGVVEDEDEEDFDDDDDDDDNEQGQGPLQIT